MAISTGTAKQLCTKAEFTLFSESSSRNVKALDAKGLRARIARARKLQDKYRQLASRQEREARGKQKPQGKRAAQGSAATRKKEQAFLEARERFEKQLARLETAQEKAAARQASGGTAAKHAGTRPVKKSARTKPASKGRTGTTAKKKAAKKKVASKKSAKKKAVKATLHPLAELKGVKKKGGSPPAKGARTKSTAARLQASGSINRQKHRSADNKRRQGRRDARQAR